MAKKTVIEELREENERLKAEIAELKTPDSYTSNGNNCFTNFDNLEDAMAADPKHEVFRVKRIKRLPDIFCVKAPIDEDGSDFKIVQCDSYKEAEAFVASLKGER